MLNILIEPLSFEFMRLALMTAILLGILCAVVGSYLIVERIGLLGDVIAHAVLPGLALAQAGACPPSLFFSGSIFLSVLLSLELLVRL